MKSVRLALGGVVVLALVGGGMLLGDDPKPKGSGRLPPNWSKLGLSDDQKHQVYTIESEYRSKIEKLQSQIDLLHKQERSELSKVLTDAQKARLREIIASKSGGDDAPKRPGKDK